MAIDISSINAVVQKELLPRVVEDVPGADRFRDWKFSVSPQPATTVWVGTVSAVEIGGLVYHYRIAFDPDKWLHLSTTSIINMLDDELEAAVRFLVNGVHAPGVLCENAFCERCYA